MRVVRPGKRNAHPNPGKRMNRTLSTSMLAAAVGAVILSTACNGGAASPASGTSTSQPAQAVVSAARELDPSTVTSTEESDHDRVTYFESIFDQLRQLPALAPLFAQYAVPTPTQYGSDDDQVGGLVTLLSQVKITIQVGTVTITNRQTGAVIFTAPLSDLASGVFYPQNVPGGTTTPATCTSFTYSPWSACAGGAQTRTVLGASPSGCTGGTPVLSQACTYTAPNAVTFQDVVSSCTGCHGLTSNTTVFKSGGYTVVGRSAAQWLTTVNGMVGMGAALAPGTTAQSYADYLANVP